MGWRDKGSHTNAQATHQLLPLSQQPALEGGKGWAGAAQSSVPPCPAVKQGLLRTWWVNQAQECTKTAWLQGAASWGHNGQPGLQKLQSWL